MRIALFLFLAAILPLAPLGAQEKLYRHQIFPDFTLKDARGAEVTIADFADTDALLVFVPSPRDPALLEIRDRWVEFCRLGVAIRGICLGSWRSLEAAAAEETLPFPLLAGGADLARRLGLLQRRSPGMLRRAYLLQPAGYLMQWFDWDETTVDEVLARTTSSLSLLPPVRRPFSLLDGRRGALLLFDRGKEVEIALELEGSAFPEGSLRAATLSDPAGARISGAEGVPLPAILPVGRQVPAILELEFETGGERRRDRFHVSGLDTRAVYLGATDSLLGDLELRAAFWENAGDLAVVLRIFETGGRPSYWQGGGQGCVSFSQQYLFRDERFNVRGVRAGGGVGCSLFRDERRRKPASTQLARWRIPADGSRVTVYQRRVRASLPEPYRFDYLVEEAGEERVDEAALERAQTEWERIKDLPENQPPTVSEDGRTVFVEWSFRSEILIPQRRPPSWLPHDWEDVGIRFEWKEGEAPDVRIGS